MGLVRNPINGGLEKSNGLPFDAFGGLGGVFFV